MSNVSAIIKSIRNIFRKDNGLAGDAQRIEQLGWMIFLKLFDDKDQEKELMNDDYISPIPEELQWRNWAADDEGITGDELLDFVDNQLFQQLKNLPVTAEDKLGLMIRSIFDGTNNYMKSGIVLREAINKLNEVDFTSSSDIHLFNFIYEEILHGLAAKKDTGEFYTPRAVTQFITDMVAPKLGEKVLDPACGTGGFLVCAIENIRKAEVSSIEDRHLLQETIMGTEYKSLPYMLAVINLIVHDIEIPKLSYDDSLNRELTSIRERDRVNVILANPPFGATVADGTETNFPMNFRTKESADLFLIMMIQLLKQGGRAGIVLPDGSLTGEGVKARVREKLLTDCNVHTIVRLPNSVFKPYASVATNLVFFEKGKSTKEVWYYEHPYPEGIKSYSKTKPIQIEEFDLEKKWWTNRVESEYSWRVSIEQIAEKGFDLDVKNPNKNVEEVLESSSTILGRIVADQKMVLDTIEEIKKLLL